MLPQAVSSKKEISIAPFLDQDASSFGERLVVSSWGKKEKIFPSEKTAKSIFPGSPSAVSPWKFWLRFLFVLLEAPQPRVENSRQTSGWISFTCQGPSARGQLS